MGAVHFSSPGSPPFLSVHSVVGAPARFHSTPPGAPALASSSRCALYRCYRTQLASLLEPLGVPVDNAWHKEIATRAVLACTGNAPCPLHICPLPAIRPLRCCTCPFHFSACLAPDLGFSGLEALVYALYMHTNSATPAMYVSNTLG
jgi:hypothetical protein